MPIPIARLLKSANERSNLAFLREGAVPTLADRKPIYEDLDNLEAELQRVDDDIARLQALREQIRTQLALSRAMVAPVRRLPSELLARIFLEHARGFVERDWSLVIATTVAGVSATWRRVACSAPEFWTHIPLASIVASTYSHLELCLSRSGSSLLHIHGEGATGEALRKQIIRLLPEAHRWKTLSLRHGYLFKLSGILACALPCLERANLRIPSLLRQYTDPDVKHLALNFLADAPRLHDLTLWTDEFREGFVLTLPASCALTTLSLKSLACDLRCVMPLIQQCSGTLQHLSLHLSPRNRSAFQPDQRIEMPRLISLDTGKDGSELLYCFRMPRLAEITMPTYSLLSMLEFFADGGASHQNIRELRLTQFNSKHLCCSDPEAEQRLLHFLQLLEHLCTFTMDMGWGRLTYPEAFVPIEVIVGKIASEGLLPSLTEITIRGDMHPGPTFTERVREMMRARAVQSTIDGRDVAALERVVEDFGYAFEPEVDG
ncbi:hypothetical protein K525DRAFT_281220 [Schizophyllum commune Loenen D]|nr:hypothetical protein K525DRAFT_281220 [Schizophyllum commune Loenen D]